MSLFLSRRHPNWQNRVEYVCFPSSKLFLQQLDHHSFDALTKSYRTSRTLLTGPDDFSLKSRVNQGHGGTWRKIRQPSAKVSLDEPTQSLSRSFYFTVSSPENIQSRPSSPLSPPPPAKPANNYASCCHQNKSCCSFKSSVHGSFLEQFFFSPAAAAAADGGGGGGGGMGGRRYCQHTHTLDKRARSDTPP